jgi:glycosyltransferase involved in cell wall biosynthesis
MRYPVWEQYWLPRQCSRDRVDLLHCPWNFGLPWSCPCPRVLTLHDAIDTVYAAPRQSSLAALRPAAWRSRLHHWVARTRADHVITVSEHAKGDLVRHLRLPPDRVTVIPEAADPRFHEPIPAEARAHVRRRHGLAQPYVFYVGGWERRKNVPFLVRAFAAAGLAGVQLVLAGGDPERQADLRQLGTELGVADRLRLLGWVEDPDLPALYAEALAFVYPSEYEGFGLQLCEAMAVGCPVLAADATSLPEVLGDGGVTFPVSDPSRLARELRRLAADPGWRNELVRRGLARSRDYDWKQTAARTTELYRSLLVGPRPTRTIRRHDPAVVGPDSHL